MTVGACRGADPLSVLLSFAKSGGPGSADLAKSCVKLGKKKGLPIVVEYVDKPGRSKTMARTI